MNSEILTKKQLADKLQVSKRTIDRRLEELEQGGGVILDVYRAFRVGRLWRFEIVKQELTNEAA